MPLDNFEHFTDGLTSPAQETFTVTPDDSAELATVTKALYVGEGGDVVLRALSSTQDSVFRNVPAGMTLDVRVLAVRATGTTAGSLVGLA